MSHKQRKALIANVTKLMNELPDAPYTPKAIKRIIPVPVTTVKEVVAEVAPVKKSILHKVVNKVTSFLTSQPQGDNF